MHITVINHAYSPILSAYYKIVNNSIMKIGVNEL